MTEELPPVMIRPATAVDAADVARVHIDAWRSTYQGIVPDAHLASLSYEKRQQGVLRWLKEMPIFCVAEHPSAGIVGFATGGPDLEGSEPSYSGQLYGMYIFQEHQRRGIGRQLVRHVAGELAAAGMCSMVIWVLVDNHPARRFYEALGGQPLGTKSIEIGGTKLEEMAYGWEDTRPLIRSDETVHP